ncbi:uncharacterized protein LACBIDRAFT_333263 [Laccaria bicolor S238N-H82]|uniref:Predicted protein n=1 Tax=Laccaria bicolor (strain S238N-H82 / ATCC MYA-4686) TaxID=486041 RepID=B0DVE8_LACBS|nr:uncharacterized protein LACBIDRAFT_333263 [Laccaria bicolor S238N-H82]EDR01408.1 predicted protein [Laccaria bicolor S238N-H82]|eukprot:XP_001887953.1 predicted protein [Laccaria bicolor S238N-H82]
MTWLQWAQFFCGWLAWTCDAIDFFSVSLSVTHLQNQFNKSTHDITTAITLTLLFRPLGAVLFGIVSDRYGRKWPLVCNLVLVAVLELGAGFVQNFKQFLALRSLFGIGMGGIWGLAASTALENLPVELRSVGSGFLQEGYAVGYLIAAVINLYLVPEVQGIFIGVVAAFVVFITIVGPEKHGSHFEQHKAAFEQGAAEDDIPENDFVSRGPDEKESSIHQTE